MYGNESSNQTAVEVLVRLIHASEWHEICLQCDALVLAVSSTRTGIPTTPSSAAALDAVDSMGIPMFEACLQGDAPIEWIDFMIQNFPHQIMNYRCPQSGHTVLLAATHYSSCRPDVLHALLRLDQTLATISDPDGLLPIDHLASAILTKTERLRYDEASKDDAEIDAGQFKLNALWECAWLLTIPDIPVQYEPCSKRQFVLHALLSTTITHVPISLINNAIQWDFRSFLVAEPRYGNLPLHLIAMKQQDPHATTMNNNDDSDQENDYNDESAETDMYILQKILEMAPGCCAISNSAGCLPLDLAIAAGRRWQTGISLLVDAYPAALAAKENDNLALFPARQLHLVLHELLTRHWRPSVVYGFLRSQPSVLLLFLHSNGSSVDYNQSAI
jgi:hypothetical protein